ncbi:hypothetical protein RYX36_036238 [Vicia faba]
MTLKLSLHFHHIPPLNLSSSSPPLRFHAPNYSFISSNTSNLFLVASSNRHLIRILTARVIGSLEQNCESKDEDELAEKSVWNQMKEIVKFTGPAIGLWLCDPLMSLIDTAVVGQGSSTELAALAALSAFTGPNNAHVVPAANTYVQVVASYMMILELNKRGYNVFAFSIPSTKEFLKILSLAAPIYLTSISKVAFFSLLIYVATSTGTQTMAAHQARLLVRSLVIIGAILGLLLGIVGTSLLWLFPNIFTSDQMVIQNMHRTLIPFFIALTVTPSTRSLEGTLLAGQDLRFFSLSTCGCFCLAALVLLISSRYGLVGCWFTLAGFQWARFTVALLRLISPNGMLYSEEAISQKLRAA